MQLSPDHCLAPKYPSASAGLCSGIGNLPEWQSYLSDRSPCSMSLLTKSDIGAVLLTHATLLEDHAWKFLTRTASRLTDSVITSRRSIWKRAGKDHHFWPACSYHSQMLRIALSGFSTCDLASARAGAGSSPEAPAPTNLPRNSAM